MKSFVVDANIVIKWILPERKNEDHIFAALSLLQAIKQDRIKVLQPPHWLAEVAAVIVRLQPSIAEEAVNLLHAMDFPIIEELEVYHIACQLSDRFNHHLFDTLYHAVALYSGNCQFITADEKYYRKAYKAGAIFHIENFLAD
jgi:predicted nucleic acid-binding protein